MRTPKKENDYILFFQSRIMVARRRLAGLLMGKFPAVEVWECSPSSSCLSFKFRSLTLHNVEALIGISGLVSVDNPAALYWRRVQLAKDDSCLKIVRLLWHGLLRTPVGFDSRLFTSPSPTLHRI
jgi:hypothetical protein